MSESHFFTLSCNSVSSFISPASLSCFNFLYFYPFLSLSPFFLSLTDYPFALSLSVSASFPFSLFPFPYLTLIVYPYISISLCCTHLIRFVVSLIFVHSDENVVLRHKSEMYVALKNKYLNNSTRIFWKNSRKNYSELKFNNFLTMFREWAWTLDPPIWRKASLPPKPRRCAVLINPGTHYQQQQ